MPDPANKPQLGRYTLLSELGRGGFAIVYHALDTSLEREIALKVLKPGWTDDQKAVERFLREARHAARLRHPHIVTIFDVGQAEGRLFIAMELIAGRSLQQVVASDGPLPWPRLILILEQAAAALEYAHQQGLVHRDIKPANLILDETRPADNPHVMLTDFGLVRGAENASLATGLSSGAILGTPEYIAPEIWEGEPATVASDLYALACVAFYLLTGKVLFGATNPMAVLKRHAQGPVFPATWPTPVPAGITEVLRQALAQDPAQRQTGASAFVGGLRDCEWAEQRQREEARQAELRRQAAAEAARRAQEEAERRQQAEAAQAAREEEARRLTLAAQEATQQAQVEAARRAAAEQEREAARQAAVEAERRAQAEAARRAAAEQERLASERAAAEAKHRAEEEAVQRAKAEQERQASQKAAAAAERRAQEEAARRARAEEERLASERTAAAAKRRADDEAAQRAQAERRAQAEVARRVKAEARPRVDPLAEIQPSPNDQAPTTEEEAPPTEAAVTTAGRETTRWGRPTRLVLIGLGVTLIACLSGGFFLRSVLTREPTPTATSVALRITDTPVPPTDTLTPTSTETSVPPTDTPTPTPTETSAPPTDTPTPTPTETSAPPTDTPTPMPTSTPTLAPVENHPPNRPTLGTPANGSTFQAMPQLCWQDSQDPDGDPVQFWVDVWTTNGRGEQSGWIGQLCWQPPTLQGADTYYWHVLAQDSAGLRSGVSPNWKFTIVTPTATSMATPTRPPATRTPVPPKPTPRPPTSTPTPTWPTLRSPSDGASVSGQVTFAWGWNGPALGSNQGFEVRIWRQGWPDHYGANDPVTTTSVTFNLAGAYGVRVGGSGRYYWTVAVVQLQPYQRIGPEAPPRILNIQVGDGGGGGGEPPTATPLP